MPGPQPSVRQPFAVHLRGAVKTAPYKAPVIVIL